MKLKLIFPCSKKRLGLFFFWAIYGIVPTLHWILLHPEGLSHSLVSAMLPRIVFMYFICGLAFFFYVTRIPERLVPGLVDIIGHSHQWWHILIFLGLYFWHNTGLAFAMFRYIYIRRIHDQCLKSPFFTSFRLKHGCAENGLTVEEYKELVMWPFH